jgi:hypothetical protein
MIVESRWLLIALAVVVACLMQHITPLCSNAVVKQLATVLGIDYSASRFASICGDWCAKPDSSLIYKLGSMLGSILGTNELVVPNRNDWKAGIHLIVAFIFSLKLLLFFRDQLRPSNSISFGSVLLFWLQYCFVVGLLVLFSNLFPHISRQDQFTIGVLSLPVFIASSLLPFSDTSRFFPRGLACLFVVICYFLVDYIHRVNLYVSFFVALCLRALFIVAGIAIFMWSRENSTSKCIVDKVSQIEGDLSQSGKIRSSWILSPSQFAIHFVFKFLIQDSWIVLRLFSILIVPFVPFNIFCEMFFDPVLLIPSDPQSYLVYVGGAFLLTCSVALIHIFWEGMRCLDNVVTPSAGGSHATSNRFSSSATLSKVFTQKVNNSLATSVNERKRLVFLTNVSMSVLLLNTMKALLSTFQRASALSSVCFFMLVCDVFFCFGFAYYFRLHMEKSEQDSRNFFDSRQIFSLCFIMLTGFNNFFFMPHEMPSLFGSSTFISQFSNCFSHDVESAWLLGWSLILHVAPIFRFVRLIFEQFFTIFEDVSRLPPALVLLKEFDTCYVIEFSGSNHDNARLDFSPLHGTATLFYQPIKHHDAVGTFVLEINGSAIAATQLSPKLLNQPLSLCFSESQPMHSSSSNSYAASSLIFRRFHRVKVELPLPHPLIFNRSTIPWVNATQWRATSYREVSLLRDGRRLKHVSCDSHKCRPVC